MQRTQTICLAILATIAVGFSLYYLKTVLLPFVIALFIVIGCRPVLTFFETKLKLSQYVAFFVAFSIGTIILIGFALTIWLSINDLTRNSGAYEDRLNAIAKWATNLMHDAGVAEPQDHSNGTTETNDENQQPRSTEAKVDTAQAAGDSDEVADDLDKGADDPEQVADDSDEGADDPDGTNETSDGDLKGGDRPVLADAAEDARQAFTEFTNFAVSFMKSQVFQVAGSLSNLLSYSVLILIFVFFLMLGQGTKEENQPTIVREIEHQVRSYLVMKTVISALTGFAFGFVLWLFGVPLAILFGFMAFLLNFIPNIGPMIAVLLPIPFLVLNAEMSPTAAIICFVLAGAIQFVSGNVIETRIMGQSFDVSPVVLLLALMFFGLVWGIIGMFLATPIVSIIKIVLQQNNSTRALAELMAGRWVDSSDHQVSV